MQKDSYSVCIIEHDNTGDHLCTWSYPGKAQSMCDHMHGAL
jgi:hypothetical protein